MNCFQVNCATDKIQMTSYCVEEGESGEDLDGGGGGHGEGAGTRREPVGGQGSDRRDIKEDAEEQRARGMDLMTVEEVVSETLVWTQR
jgi:hypothetical protein